MSKATFYTASELSKRTSADIPSEFTLSSHLIYSSPATLAYNSPGAKGFGVKRAGLSIPGSVMLIISPGCCGRNTSELSTLPQYRDRFFYLTMDETDLVTGRHLSKISGAIDDIITYLGEKPSLVMLCVTCADALLGTDMDRVSRQAEEKCGVRVRPCYMYALTREGRKPPMVHVRQSLYSLLEKRKRRSTHVNLLGFFAGLFETSELYTLLKSAGVKKINEISRCASYDEFMGMSEASFNIVLNQEARAAADDLSTRLGQPYVELQRFHDVERIHRQYNAFFHAIGAKCDDSGMYENAKKAVEDFSSRHKGLAVSIGESMNGNPFELAVALSQMGVAIKEIFAVVTAESYFWIDRLSELSPQTRIYCNQDPSMLYYNSDETKVDITIGRDAGLYHSECPNVAWNSDEQPFGYDGLIRLLGAVDAALSSGELQKPIVPENVYRPEIVRNIQSSKVKGFRKILTPFAPDQSGAVSLLYGLGGLIVIIDAGGCTGNVCGFDEPRWTDSKSAVFSAGLRDMDAILGRDEALVQKLENAAKIIDAKFIALVGTPVPAVIGTDYRALATMVKKRTGIDVIAVSSNGMDLYDKGIEKAELELVSYDDTRELLGFTPLDFMGITEDELMAEWKKSAKTDMLVVSSGAIKAAKKLAEKTGKTYEIGYPLAGRYLRDEQDLNNKKILIVHSQVAANSLRDLIRSKYPSADVTVASFFMMNREIKESQDVKLREENDFMELAGSGFDHIFADECLKALAKDFSGEWTNMTHFAISGTRPEGT